MTDDQGYADVGFTNPESPFVTKNIDRIANFSYLEFRIVTVPDISGLGVCIRDEVLAIHISDGTRLAPSDILNVILYFICI